MISYLFNFTVFVIFILSFIHLVEYSKDQLFIKQAGVFALRSHYLNENYLNTLHGYSQKTCKKPYTFRSTFLTENHSVTQLNLKPDTPKYPLNTSGYALDIKKTPIETNLFYLGKKP